MRELYAFEAFETHLLVKEKGADKFEIVVPSISTAAERSISLAAKRGEQRA